MNPENHITVLIKNLSHGGAEKVCVTLCNELTERSYHVELWILDYRDTSLTQQLHENINVIDLKKKNVRKSFFKLLKLLYKQKPSKLLVFNIELAILAILIKKILFLKTEIIFRSINTLSRAFQFPKSIWEKYFAIKAIKLILPYCNKIIAQSKGMKADLVKYFGINENKIYTIPNPAVNLSALDSQTSVPKQQKNDFLFVGRLQAQKGLVNLLKIFERAHKEKPDIRLIIVGDGPEEEKLKAIAASQGLNSSVIFEGYQPTTFEYFSSAKATVLTSLYEGFPNVLVESIATGTPVLAFNCPSGPEDIIIQGVNGILVPDQDINAFTQAVLSVANDEIRFEKQKIIETSKKFSVEVVVNKYEQLLKN